MNMAKGTLYLKNENNEFRWIENESTDKYDGKYVDKLRMMSLMVMEFLLIKMERDMKVSGKMGKDMVKGHI